MAHIHSATTDFDTMAIGNYEAVWASPKEEPNSGVILYLHGGGYCAGNLQYAEGVGSTLSGTTNRRVFCPAYRLAPEHPCPAALEDALHAYEYLLLKDYSGGEIVLCGESAGGGLVYCLMQMLIQNALPLPAGIVAISPWTDLTLSGASINDNRDTDPTLTRELLEFYVKSYCTEEMQPGNPLVSPLFAELYGFPPSLIFAGGDELVLTDAVRMHERLLSFGASSRLSVEPGLWHSWPLYHIKESREALKYISDFVEECIA